MKSHFTATLATVARHVDGEVIGNGNTLITGVSGLDNPEHGDIVFVEQERLLPLALESPASAVILGRNMALPTKPSVRVDNPKLAFAQVLALFAPARPRPRGIHPTAQIAPTARVDKSASVGAGVIIEDRVQVGAGSVLMPYCYVGYESKIGEECVIHPHVVIHDRVTMGDRVTIHTGSVIGDDGFGYVRDGTRHVKMPQVGVVEIGDDVEIGANATIDRATVGATEIGRGTKIDNLVQVGHNVVIGEDCIICAQTGISGSTVLEDRVILGGQVGIGDHIRIGADAIVGAQGGVISDVNPGVFVSGYPAGPHREKMKVEAAIRRLPDLLKTIRELQKQVQELQRNQEEGQQPGWKRVQA